MSEAEIITILITGLRSNMKYRLMSVMDKIMLSIRSVIETINDELKNVAMLVHSRHRSFENFVMNVISVIAAYCFFDKKPAINMDFDMEDPMPPTLFLQVSFDLIHTIGNTQAFGGFRQRWCFVSFHGAADS